MLTFVVATVEEVPQLRALILRIPLPVLVTEAIDALFGAGFLLVAPSASEQRVELVITNRPQKRGRLQSVARRTNTHFVGDATGVDVLLHAADHEPELVFIHGPVAKLQDFGEISPVSTCRTGKGGRAGMNALRARCSITIESLPPENSSAGRSNSAATSRMMWMDWASSERRWLSL